MYESKSKNIKIKEGKEKRLNLVEGKGKKVVLSVFSNVCKAFLVILFPQFRQEIVIKL